MCSGIKLNFHMLQSFPIEAQLTTLIDAGKAFRHNWWRGKCERATGLCRGMQWYSKTVWGTLCSGSSFPHHVVNGLWLVLSDAPALGYLMLMCSAHSVSCCIASTSQKMSLPVHNTRHKERKKKLEITCVIRQNSLYVKFYKLYKKKNHKNTTMAGWGNKKQALIT